MYHLIKSLYLHATSLPEYSVLLLGLDAAGKTTLLNQVKSIYNTANTSNTLPSTSTDQDDPHRPRPRGVGDTVPTVGQNVATIRLADLYLRLWDVGGQESLRGLWAHYFRSCHAIVFVLDSTDVGDGDLPERFLSEFARSSLAGNGADDEGSSSSSNSTKKAPFAYVPRAGTDDDGEDSGRLREAAAVLTEVLGHADAEGVPLLVLANKQDREDSVEVVRIKEGFVRHVVEGERGGRVRDSRVLPCSALRGTGVREAVEWVRTRVLWNREGRPGVLR